MSSHIYAVVLVKPGHERFDAGLGHDPAAAGAFLQQIAHRRHVPARDFGPGEYLAPPLEYLVIQANASGVVAFNLHLALDMATNGAKARRAAALGPRLLAVAYNDQALTDYVTYYEDGVLRRRISESDGDRPQDIVLEGEWLPEEIASLEASSPHPDCDPEELTRFEVDGKTYEVEGATADAWRGPGAGAPLPGPAAGRVLSQDRHGLHARALVEVLVKAAPA